MKMISEADVKRVQELRAIRNSKGKPMTLERIRKKTKLPMRKIAYILYERGNCRVMEMVAYRTQQYRVSKSIPSFPNSSDS